MITLTFLELLCFMDGKHASDRASRERVTSFMSARLGCAHNMMHARALLPVHAGRCSHNNMPAPPRHRWFQSMGLVVRLLTFPSMRPDRSRRRHRSICLLEHGQLGTEGI